MTNGSCHSTCESNVHTWLKPGASACFASSTTPIAGGSHCSTTPTSMPSPHLREAQVDLGRGRVRPAGGDDLAAGVELDGFRAVHVQVTEERGLPAAEAVVGDRDRDRHVDADHPADHVVLELAGRA